MKRQQLFFLASLFFPATTFASGVAIDKIYSPYIDPLAWELEYRVIRYEENGHTLDNVQAHRLGISHALTDRLAGEIYMTGTHTGNNDFNTSGFELELRWQATEQGEYAVDTGFIFELEHDKTNDEWEASTGIIIAHEFDRLVATGNIYLIREESKITGNEWEMAANGQLRYRLNPHLEPAIEIYRAEDTFGIGPMLGGTERLGIGKKLHWEFGIIAGLVNDTPATTFKALLEYEF